MHAIIITSGSELAIEDHPKAGIKAVFELENNVIPKGVSPSGVSKTITGGPAVLDAEDYLKNLVPAGEALRIDLANLEAVIGELAGEPKAILNLLRSEDDNLILSISVPSKYFLIPVGADDKGVKNDNPPV